MKKLSLTLCALTALVAAAYAGTETYSGKDKQVMPPPCPQWYADTEWNVTLSGIYAPTTNDWRDDRYLFADHGWGGAIDAKYFFHRYFGVGLQGFGIGTDSNDNRRAAFFRNDNDFVGGALGTFTFRYPIPCSRFAPYAWAGAGAVFNGSDDNNNNFRNDDNDARFLGQFGGGFEVRFTPHFGWTNDVSYNVLESSNNDFIQIRTGLNFAF